MATPREHLLTVLRQLPLDKGKYVLFGSAPLAIRNLRYIGDLDVFVSKEYWDELHDSMGWTLHRPREDDPPFLEIYVEGVRVTVFYEWTKRKWSPDLASYLKAPEVMFGYPFVPLKAMLEWKNRMRHNQRQKDEDDIELIEGYLDEIGAINAWEDEGGS